MPAPVAVDREGAVLGLLRAVDVGPGGAVDDHAGPLLLDLRADGRGIRDVQLGVAEPDHLVAGVARREHHVAARASPPAPVTSSFIR